MDIYKNIKNGKYEQALNYPMSPRLVCNKCNKSFSKDDKFCRKCGANVSYQFETETERYKSDMTAYRKNERIQEDLFKKDVFEYVGLEPGKIAELVYSKAWEDGHSYGYEEILSELEEIVEFMKELKGAGF